MDSFAPHSEWSGPPISLEAFLASPAWQSLPFAIQVAFAHLWMAEHPSPEEFISRSLWTTAEVAAKAGVMHPPVTTQSATAPNLLPETTRRHVRLDATNALGVAGKNLAQPAHARLA